MTAMRAGKVVVVNPTLNEQDSIADVVGAIPRPPVDEVIIADGPSSDATAARAAGAGADHQGRARLWPRLCSGG